MARVESWLIVVLLITITTFASAQNITAKNKLDVLKVVNYQPRHVHLAYGENPSEMFLTWNTLDPLKGRPKVEFGIARLDEKVVEGYSTKFTDTGDLHLSQYVHRVTLKQLIPGQTYIYHCGSDLGWSGVFGFTAMPNGTDWLPSLAIYGDLGNSNAQSLVRIQREVQLGAYDAILHVGDFAYDMDSENGMVGDSFMEQIEPIAAYVPYMTCPGNHEYRDDFNQYKSRFTMPGGHDSMFYSFNMGPIHFIGFSTEAYYFLQYGLTPCIEQYEWLEKDLEEASKPENRAIRPWIITYGHRPMYCSNNNTDDCTTFATRVRVGVPFLHMFGLEDMFMKYGVDMSIWAHEHSYERMFPMYDYKVYNGTEDQPYTNPRGIVHVTTGSAGCLERHDDFLENVPEYTAFRSTDYGYSRLKILNRTTLYMEQVSDDQDGKVIDSFYLVRQNHEAYAFPN